MAPSKNSPKVIIVGRPNVGKSTLYNTLIKDDRKALVDPTPGVTRDTRFGSAEVKGLRLELADTAGIEVGEKGMAGRLNVLTEAALKDAQLVVFLLDGKTGVLSEDYEIARQLRDHNLPVLLVVNKCDTNASEDTLMEAYSLGFGGPLPISAAHSQGMHELARIVAEKLEECGAEEGEDIEDDDKPKPLPLAIVGQPNAGKSTLVNTLLEKERMLTGDEAGLTRESVGTLWQVDDKLIELVDTPGIRKKARIAEKLEKMSVTDAFSAVEKAEAVILVLDASLFDKHYGQTEAFERQDAVIADKVLKQGKPLIIALNKWDRVEDKDACMEEVRIALDFGLAQVRDIPLVPISALKKKGVDKLLPEVLEKHKLWQTRLGTAQLNRFLEEVTENNPPPVRKGRRLKIKYMTQLTSAPPTFAVWVNMPKSLPESYLRYVTNRLKDAFNLHGIVVRLYAKTSENPYAGKKKKA